jgi:hypothetical protein
MNYDELFKMYESDYYIETGTGGGGSLKKAILCNYKKYFSVEPYTPMYEKAAARFTNQIAGGQLKLYNNKSEIVLPEIMDQVNSKATFFLDAHQNAPHDRILAGSNPILEELKIIAKHHIKNHTIICDDSEHFIYMGTNLKEVTEHLLNINPNYTINDIKYRNGVLVAHID